MSDGCTDCARSDERRRLAAMKEAAMSDELKTAEELRKRLYGQYTVGLHRRVAEDAIAALEAAEAEAERLRDALRRVLEWFAHYSRGSLIEETVLAEARDALSAGAQKEKQP